MKSVQRPCVQRPYDIQPARELSQGSVQGYRLSYLRLELAYNILVPKPARKYELRLFNLWKPHSKQGRIEFCQTYRHAQARFAKLAKQMHIEYLIERSTERLKYGLCASTMRFEDRRHDFQYDSIDGTVVCIACGQLRWEDKYPPIESVEPTQMGGGE